MLPDNFRLFAEGKETVGAEGNCVLVTSDRLTELRMIQASLDIAQQPRGEDLLPTFSTLLDNIDDAVIVRDSENRIRFWNKGAERLYGWRADEVTGQNLYYTLFVGQSEVQEKQARRLAETGQWAGELIQITKARQCIVVESRWILQRDAFNRATSVLIVNRDITDKRVLERELLRAQRIETVAKLSLSIVHDLNSMLSSMLIMMRTLLREHIELKNKYCLESWQFCAERAMQLITELLSLPNDTSEEFTSINVGLLIEETAKILRCSFPPWITIETAVPADLHTVFGNPTHLYQVLLNLCVNGRDAMASGGTLKIRAANVVLDDTAARHLPEAEPGTYVSISVADTGSGIPAEIANRIFEPFFTTKDRDKGSGLGLFTVLRIVKDHNGFIDLTTDLKRGAQFVVYVPSENLGQ